VFAVIVTGAPGAGKTRTLAALADALIDAEVAHASGDVDELAWSYPYPDVAGRCAHLRAWAASHRDAGLDVLVVGECGKNYSGAGMDPNVVGRMLIEASPEAETNDPRVTRMAVLDVSPESHGNGTGIGIADLTTNRALAAIDPVPFRMNNLTARFLWRSKLPIGFDTDRECVAMAVETCWQPVFDKLKVAVIPNTLEVAELWVSAALAAEAKGNPHLEFVSGPQPLPFDAAGNLVQEKLFPHSVRGRRGKAH